MVDQQKVSYDGWRIMERLDLFVAAFVFLAYAWPLTIVLYAIAAILAFMLCAYTAWNENLFFLYLGLACLVLYLLVVASLTIIKKRINRRNGQRS
jgi:hypothetical protein